MAGLKAFWENYKVLIVMGSSLGLIHWGWYTLKSNPAFHKGREDYYPEPAIVGYVAPPSKPAESGVQGKVERLFELC
ncbi:hypothetical protein AALO_G00097700 [Alosa alosa]|uniref:Uncharacterized protein n=1 Tax=Alosa alosa TaxID=278164 RepID=A0AAV6GU49_9TELE|nr:hypothetical protein AALO_G00097700 [Alosa alosa]